jgi:hypothetical protein
MRLRISGGYTAAVVMDLTDRLGRDLSTSTFQVALLGVDVTEEGVPAAGSGAWKNPTGVDTSTAGVAVITWAVSEGTGYPLGRYRAWAKASVSPFLLLAKARDETIELV